MCRNVAGKVCTPPEIKAGSSSQLEILRAGLEGIEVTNGMLALDNKKWGGLRIVPVPSTSAAWKFYSFVLPNSDYVKGFYDNFHIGFGLEEVVYTQSWDELMRAIRHFENSISSWVTKPGDDSIEIVSYDAKVHDISMLPQHRGWLMDLEGFFRSSR